MTTQTEQHESVPTTPALKSRRFQYSLASLFVLMTVSAVVFRFPNFVVGCIGLLFGVLVTLVLFFIVIYGPVTYLLLCYERATSSNDEKPATEAEENASGSV